MSYDWGPHFIVPTDSLKDFSGHILLREYFDEGLLSQELEELGIEGTVEGATNPWYYRRKNTDTWIKIGESGAQEQNFPVSWNTRDLENGQYEVLGWMHVFMRKGRKEYVVARQRIVEVTVQN